MSIEADFQEPIELLESQADETVDALNVEQEANPALLPALESFQRKDSLVQECDSFILFDSALHLIVGIQQYENDPFFILSHVLFRAVARNPQDAELFFQLCAVIIFTRVDPTRRSLVRNSIIDWVQDISVTDARFQMFGDHINLEHVRATLLAYAHNYLLTATQPNTDEWAVFSRIDIDNYVRRYENLVEVDDGDHSHRYNPVERTGQVVQSPYWRLQQITERVISYVESDKSQEEIIADITKYFEDSIRAGIYPLFLFSEIQELFLLVDVVNQNRTHPNISDLDKSNLQLKIAQILVDVFMLNDVPITALSVSNYSRSYPNNSNLKVHTALYHAAESSVFDGSDNVLKSILMGRCYSQHPQEFLTVFSRFINGRALQDPEHYNRQVSRLVSLGLPALGAQKFCQVIIAFWEHTDDMQFTQGIYSNRVQEAQFSAFIDHQLTVLAGNLLAGDGAYIYSHLTENTSSPVERFDVVYHSMQANFPLVSDFCRQHDSVFKQGLIQAIEVIPSGEFFHDHLIVDVAREEHDKQREVIEKDYKEFLSELSGYLFAICASDTDVDAPAQHFFLQSTLGYFIQFFPEWIDEFEKVFVLCVRRAPSDEFDSPEILLERARHILTTLFSDFQFSFDTMEHYSDSQNSLPDDWNCLESRYAHASDFIHSGLRVGHIGTIINWIDAMTNSEVSTSNLGLPALANSLQLKAIVDHIKRSAGDTLSDAFESWLNKAISAYVENVHRSPEETIYDLCLYTIRGFGAQNSPEKEIGDLGIRCFDLLFQYFPLETSRVLCNVIYTSLSRENWNDAVHYALLPWLQLEAHHRQSVYSFHGIIRQILASICDYDDFGRLEFSVQTPLEKEDCDYLNLWIQILRDSGSDQVVDQIFNFLLIQRELAAYGEIRSFETKAQHADALQEHCKYLFGVLDLTDDEKRRLPQVVRKYLRGLETEQKQHLALTCARRHEIGQQKQYPPFKLTQQQSQQITDFHETTLHSLDAFLVDLVQFAHRKVRSDNIVYGSYLQVISHYIIRDFYDNADGLRSLLAALADLVKKRGEVESHGDWFFAFFSKLDEHFETTIIPNIGDYFKELLNSEERGALPRFDYYTERINSAFNKHPLGNDNSVSALECQLPSTNLRTLEIHVGSTLMQIQKSSDQVVHTINAQFQGLLKPSNWKIENSDDLGVLLQQLDYFLVVYSEERQKSGGSAVNIQHIRECVYRVLVEAYVLQINENDLYGHFFHLFVCSSIAFEQTEMNQEAFRQTYHYSLLIALRKRFGRTFDQLYADFFEDILRTDPNYDVDKYFNTYIAVTSPQSFMALCERHFLTPECMTFHPLAPNGRECLNRLLAFVSGDRRYELLVRKIIRHIAQQQLTP